MNDITKEKVVSNFIWRFAERVGAQLVAFVVSIILARILDPSAYGTVALISVFIVILQVFVDSGLGNALIQKKDADDIDFSTVFFVNILFCTTIYLILFIIAPYISEFYGDITMTPYIRVLGITILISGIKNVQQAYVSRNMMFKRFFFSTLGGTLIAGIVGILLAYLGCGVWALVIQQVVNISIDTTILWVSVKWRPSKKFSIKRLSALFSFGWKLLVSSLIDTVYNNLRQLLIGKVYSSTDLAYYNQGDKFPKLIVTNINTSIDSVLLPAMSNVQDNKDIIRNMTRKSIKTSVYIMAPLMIGLAVCGKSIVGLILTDKWLPCVFFMQIFCITYMFWPIHTANLNAIKALGRSDLFLILEVCKKAVGLVLLLTTMFISVKAMAYSLLLSTVISMIINSWPNKKLLNYSFIEQIRDIIPSILLALFMGGCIYTIQYLGLSYLVTLLIQIPLGAIIYIVGSKLLHLDSFEDIVAIIVSYTKR